jgi:hypothetical protein
VEKIQCLFALAVPGAGVRHNVFNFFHAGIQCSGSRTRRLEPMHALRPSLGVWMSPVKGFVYTQALCGATRASTRARSLRCMAMMQHPRSRAAPALAPPCFQTSAGCTLAARLARPCALLVQHEIGRAVRCKHRLSKGKGSCGTGEHVGMSITVRSCYAAQCLTRFFLPPACSKLWFEAEHFSERSVCRGLLQAVCGVPVKMIALVHCRTCARALYRLMF